MEIRAASISEVPTPRWYFRDSVGLLHRADHKATCKHPSTMYTPSDSDWAVRILDLRIAIQQGIMVHTFTGIPETIPIAASRQFGGKHKSEDI